MSIAADADRALDFDWCYRAVKARDTRFDGQFIVAVHTTGIYCRPSCPAQTPRAENVHFVLTAATAQAEGFRACRRCLPDAVPGSPRWNAGADLSSRAMRLIGDGVVERDGVDGLAEHLGYSARHLTRVLTAELGAGPLALARAHRATNARTLIQCTSMPMTDIAFAAGFSSVRQFNDTIRDVFALTPTRLRALRPKGSTATPPGAPGTPLTLRLAHRKPLHSRWLHWFLSAHQVDGLEEVTIDDETGWRSRRVLDLPHGPALVTATPADGHLQVEFAHLDMRDLGVAVNRIRRLFDLDADTAAADEALATDPALGPLVAAAPGLRVPGSVDPAETLIRTMIGQQISVKAARHHVNRLITELGAPIDWADDPGWRRFPTPAVIAEHGASVLTGPRRRIESIVGAAGRLADGRLELHPGLAASDMRATLMEQPGIGAWTADYVAMRVTGDPDILLDRDLVIRQSADALGIDLDHDTRRWAPWRSYASMYLWHHRLSAADPILQPSGTVRAADQTTSDAPMTPEDATVVAALDPDARIV
ncbi:AlkA N-terminal domain-containing protein [Gordonia soli]|uniref:DNA-3-methyladenine glycosylase II n=1 Tax=Gordonia soli NBRC 108243 TaxID=1223545 RepID=M0QD67_9ACTN|nr:AlkA N-terminal domain-containing protein [Gordonia soli]GAC66515.1 putative transcriptional regulator/DNA-3-methyladenine glycosylase II [Gordonia soli NBRC 108243]